MLQARTTTEPSPADESKAIGLCLDSELPQVAFWSGSALTGHAENVKELCSISIPPSALLPRLRGEPIRADLFWPCHVRGSGRPWPPEARVSSDTGIGRLPIAYAWAMLSDSRSVSDSPDHPPWHWEYEEWDKTIKPTDAIATVADTLLGDSNHNDHEPVLVIPNHLKSWTQQELIDSFMQQHGRRVRLLWRPVAAAMAWCREFNEDLLHMAPNVNVGEPLGHIAVLHAGLDCLEATRIEFVLWPCKDGESRILPARGRSKRSSLPRFGLAAIEQLATLSASELSNDKASQTWNMLWASPWLPAVLDTIRGTELHEDVLRELRNNGLPLGTRQAVLDIWDKAYSSMGQSGDGPLSELTHPVPAFPSATVVKKWISDNLDSLGQSDGRLLGAVVTGPMADMLYKGKDVGQLWLDKMGVSSDRVLIEGRNIPRGVLAQMASLHSLRLSQGLPTYLDTLPRIKIVVKKLEEPVWEDLLKEDDTYVDGGQKWNREGVGKGQMKLAPNRSDFHVALFHEEYPTVRAVTSKLPQEYQDPVPISLSVSVIPAQGNARIEIVPDSRELFDNKRLLFDWRTMTDTQQDPDQWLSNIPRICPAPTTRLQSLKRFDKIEPIAQRILNARPSGKTLITQLNYLSTKLQQPEIGIQNQYAFGSAGIRSTHIHPKSKVHAYLAEFLVEIIQKTQRFSKRRKIAYRVLGHMYSPSTEFQSILTGLVYSKWKYEAWELMAIGRCLRDPETTGEFCRAVLKRLQESLDDTSNWLRAFSEVVKYREEALLHTPSDLCFSITKYLTETFEACIAREGPHFPKIIFRHSCVGIVYLLRRRIYDNNYLDPNLPLAKRIKKAFRRAKKLASEGKIILPGGMVDLQAELQQLIDYIDRRGRGEIVMATRD